MSNLITLPTKQKSKRSALRYRIRQGMVSYEKEEEIGEAILLNISTAGLLVELATVPVAVGDRISVILSCFPNRDNGEPLTLETEVVRVALGEFAGKFLDIAQDDARFLSRCLSRDARRNRFGGKKRLESVLSSL